MSAQEELRNMILSFRVSELNDLLGFAGRNKSGKKQELQSRALDLLKLHSVPVQMKIQELHKRRFNTTGLMPNNTMQDPMNSAAKLAMVSVPHTEDTSQALVLRNPMSHPMNYRSNMNYGNPSQGKPMPLNMPQLSQQSKIPINPDVQFKPLPFYDVLSVLIKPTSLSNALGMNFQEGAYEFSLSPQQVNEILNSKTFCGMNSEFGIQIQLRFCLLETSCEQDDNFPPSVLVKVNQKVVTLPSPIPTNRPGVVPKRPSRPVNITHYSKLTPMQKNMLSISWASEYSQPHCLALFLVRKLDSKILMSRLRTKGMRNPDHTRAMIKEKLTPSPDSEIATTSLRGSLLCPIGKKKMTEPCRPLTCTHLQCFDADLFIKMNEKKPRWICPVCDKPAPFNALAIDGLFSEISAKAPSSCNEVQFHEDGSWTPIINDKDVKDTYNIDGSIQTIINPVRKKAKRDHIEVVTLSDSDTEEEWQAPSVVPQIQFKSQVSLELKLPPASFQFAGKMNPSAHEPFISLPSPSSPFVDTIEPSPAPPAVASPQSISSQPFVPLSGSSHALVKPLPTAGTESGGKDSELDSPQFNANEATTSMQNNYPEISYNNSTYSSYYSSPSSPPHDTNNQGFTGTDTDGGNNECFDLFSLLTTDMEPQMARSANSDKSPDIISID